MGKKIDPWLRASEHICVTMEQKEWFEREAMAIGIKTGSQMFDRLKAGYELAKVITARTKRVHNAA